MYNDVFNEQLVKKQMTYVDMLKKSGIIMGAVILLLLIFFWFPPLLIIAIPIKIVIVVFLFKRANIEYEYILTNSNLDIDKIYNKSSRKKCITIDVKSFIIMVQVNKSEYIKELSQYDNILNYSSGVIKDNTYAVIFNKNGKRCKLIFEPNERLLKSIKLYCPRAFDKLNKKDVFA